MNEQNKALGFIGWPVGVGLLVLGVLLGNAIGRFKDADRYVSVKGLSEREVTADLVIWPIAYKDSSADLTTLYERLNQKNAVIVKFLKDHGFNDAEIIVTPASISDVLAEAYQNVNPASRYKSTANITVRTANVKNALQAMGETNQLVKSGVALFREEWVNKPEFIFTGLNAIKPAMIEEATKNGRQAAEKFAQDSGSKIGAIRRASQGLFTIEEFDKSSPQRKRVRVVTTVDFSLE